MNYLENWLFYSSGKCGQVELLNSNSAHFLFADMLCLKRLCLVSQVLLPMNTCAADTTPRAGELPASHT